MTGQGPWMLSTQMIKDTPQSFTNTDL